MEHTFSTLKRMLFVYNPHAGKGAVAPKISEMLDIFVKGGYLVSAYPTQQAGDCYRIVAEISDRFDMVVACGGDGTLNEAIKGLMECDVKKTFAYIPAGTTNDFATTLHIPKDLIYAAHTAVDGIPFECDLGQFGDEHYFTYVAAFGAFTSVSYETPQKNKNIFGHLAYVIEGVKQIASLESYVITVDHDGEEITDEYILGMVTNTVSVGGFKKLTDIGVILDDGLFEVILIKAPQSPMDLQNILTCVLKQELNPQYFTSFKTSKVTFKSDNEISWTIDGENGGKHNEITIRNKMRAFSIHVNYPDSTLSDSLTKEIEY